MQIPEIVLPQTLPGSLSARDVERVNTQAAAKVQQLVKRNFETLGGRRFWFEAAQATRLYRAGTSATITVEHCGVRLRFYGSGGLPGGVVRPRNRIWLAIPNSAKFPNLEAPRRYKDLRFVLAAGENRKNPRRAMLVRGTDVVFWLRKETKHAPNPRVLPAPAEIRKEAAAAAAAAVKLLLRKR